MAALQASVALSSAVALGANFPFNLVVGIPLYTALAQRLTA